MDKIIHYYFDSVGFLFKFVNGGHDIENNHLF